MGVLRAGAGPDLVADRTRQSGSAAAVLDFAVAQILRDDTALGALPTVLARLADTFGLHAALAFRPSAAHPATVLAMHPPGAVDRALLARIGALALPPREGGGGAADGGPVQVRLEPEDTGGSGGTGSAGGAASAAGSPATTGSAGREASALLAYSVPVDGQCLCALALIGNAASWDAEVRATAHAVAAIVATQIRHASDMAELTERQTLTRALITASPAAILAMDADGRLVEFNAAAEELSGYRRDDVLGRPMWEHLVPERDRPRFLEHVRTYLATGDPEEFTGQMRVSLLCADGSERTAELTPVQVTIGRNTMFAGFLHDPTELERLHAALADQTERLSRLISAAIPGILITEEQGLVTHVSQSFGTIYGIAEPEELVGTTAASVMNRVKHSFADPDEFARRITKLFHARRPVSGEQSLCADGRTLECDYWPVLVDGRWRGDLWLCWDISERAELEQKRLQMLKAELAGRRLAEQAQRQLAEQNERLRKIDEARNQFIAIVSHEMRTPLTSIISFSELIRGEADGLSPDGIHFLDIIERNADRLHRLIGDLLMLDRLEAGKLPLELAPVSIPDLAAEAVRSASAREAKEGVTIDVTAGSGPAVPGDQRRLAQVLDNLISNAVKFSNRNGWVHVRAGYQGGSWRVDVSDSGIGIPPDEVGRLFSRFVRGSNARTAGLPGAGLGLSIVKVLVEMHGGRVEVESTLGHGSTFSVYLPALPMKDPG